MSKISKQFFHVAIIYVLHRVSPFITVKEQAPLYSATLYNKTCQYMGSVMGLVKRPHKGPDN